MNKLAPTRLPALDWESWPTRFVFFTGKGGVGKTTIAAAVAVDLADNGTRVLLVSTDPASNLAAVLASPTSKDHPVAVPTAPGLDVLDLDPRAAADGYRERVLSPYRGVLPDAELAAFTEQLAGACTVEVAAFDTFARLLTDPQLSSRYEKVIFDTAPTGHTLRLLALPAAWSSYLTASPNQVSCLGPLAALDAQRQVYEQAVTVLGDSDRTELTLVTRADRPALAEAARAASELADLGIRRQRLIVNAVLAHPLPGDPIAQAYAAAQQVALAGMPTRLRGMTVAHVPLVGADLTGIEALRDLAAGRPSRPVASGAARPPAAPGLDELIGTLAAGPARAILVTGKGGVGKTTIATRIAVGLASLGHPVHLSTTDPAGQLPQLSEAPATLTGSRIDPTAETASYIQQRLAAAGNLDPHQRELLDEELRSPCTTELAVFRAFNGLLLLARHQFVVIDTAPSGHTLLLLDLTGAYHRQAVTRMRSAAGRVTTPLMRLQDPTFSRLLIVTLPETTPVQEAADLQADLRRAGVEPYGWIINASLAAAGTRDPLLAARAALELPLIERVSGQLTGRTWLVSWTTDPAGAGPTNRVARHYAATP